jgi:thiol:disulfide interchange protein DsbD
MTFRLLVGLWALLLGLIAVDRSPAMAEPVARPHITAELASQTAGVAPGSTVYLAVILTAQKSWHTYWRNPGDAGEATQIAWTLPPGWKAGDIVWPPPHRLPVGPIMNYGFEGRAVLAVPVQIPASAKPGRAAHIAARVDYLVCQDVCVPGSADLALDLPVVAGTPKADPVWGEAIAAALSASPKPAGLTARFQPSAGRLSLAVSGPPLSGPAAGEAYFYPFSDSLIDHAKPQAAERGVSGLTLSLVPSSGTHSAPSIVAGVLSVGEKAFEITATQGPAPAGASGLGPLAGKPAAAAVGSGGLTLATAAGFAFLGGLILNLMPCVFPILSMKAAALSRHAAAGDGAKQGLAFLAGVLATFIGLAAALLAARAAGAAVGWGFQLQSPLAVALLSLVMLGAALNLSGLFEIGLSLQGLGSGLQAHGETLGSFLTGALAVVVAAPCTAPFMGPALGFALTQTPTAALAVFAALGLGFALPFVAIAFSPALTRRLPRPGPWMDGLKKALAFPMYGAAAWLLWVLAQQTGPEGLARLLTAALILALAAWLMGVGQRRAAGGAGGAAFVGLAAVCLALSVGAVVARPFPAAPGNPGGSAARAAPTQDGALISLPYSAKALADLRAAGRPVLVNFTAAWCVTCQVNERVVFSSPVVAAAARKAGVAYLVADWTNRDAEIAKALSAQGRIGVPLYLYYGRGAAAPTVLPQILTNEIVVSAFNS